MNAATLQSSRSHTKKIAAEVGLKISLLLEDELGWDKVLEQSPFTPCNYSRESIEYETCYFNTNEMECLDLSMIISSGGTKLALWPLSINKIYGVTKLTSQGLPVCMPLFIENISPRTKREIIAKLFSFIENFAVTFNINLVHISDTFSGNFGLSEWHLEALSRNLPSITSYNSYLQISGSAEAIRKNFRKRAREYALQAQKIWLGTTLDSSSQNIDEVWSQFKLLHLEASGRKTRSDETWDIQKNMVKSNRAILIYLRDTNHKMVGASFFQYTNTEAMYHVAANDRALFNKPIGHLIQYIAVEEFIKRKILWYNIGTYIPNLASNNPAYSDKQIKISHFKKQFSSHVFPSYTFTLTL